MKVLTVFIDGLKPESIKHMKFLNKFNKKRIRTELGYSNTCHASMYSGTYPNKHKIWFIWKYSPNTSPFRWLDKLKINRFPHNIYTKYAFYRITKFFYKNNSSAFGLPFLWYMPLNKWHFFDVSEKKFWTEDKFLNGYGTIFEILRESRINYEIIGLSKDNLNNSVKTLKAHKFTKFASWTYIFIGDIDPMSHEFGQNSNEVVMKLHEIDNLISEIYEQLKKDSEDFCFILFSDHGHEVIKDKINLRSIFESQGSCIDKYIYFIDANFARFWFMNEDEKNDVSSILSKIGDKGYILTQKNLMKYNINMPDHRYGDLIFYLDHPYVFDQGNIIVFGKERSDTGKYISFHGFLPDYPDSDGVLISDKPLIDEKYITLEDIVPSILNQFKIEIPDSIDGKAIWK